MRGGLFTRNGNTAKRHIGRDDASVYKCFLAYRNEIIEHFGEVAAYHRFGKRVGDFAVFYHKAVFGNARKFAVRTGASARKASDNNAPVDALYNILKRRFTALDNDRERAVFRTEITRFVRNVFRKHKALQNALADKIVILGNIALTVYFSPFTIRSSLGLKDIFILSSATF